MWAVAANNVVELVNSFEDGDAKCSQDATEEEMVQHVVH